jgi:hypothetical protein
MSPPPPARHDQAMGLLDVRAGSKGPALMQRSIGNFFDALEDITLESGHEKTPCGSVGCSSIPGGGTTSPAIDPHV